ncbi:FAD-binding oxidoreductase [Verminephrobacter aporrectodeae subsp. tuberculatae]|uniref:NAD(P)/FAD-dependent oxidoreductase n=1 Tax=Verminephrobacter aporrectodeae TaxID=1110389 RepID=UPI00224365B2|nr:FAD-binding oxidoreductase [Verminephrobacter aporrectodeae]MCW8164235.1 FAD-binding oxidoreductase [Verminephrobacter aporrectodeae subsp. tuberculatae]MCW8168829.1 FAD-binding oxidoreductase [Verminephrobacter aporrectodeae subsp. tuberculatae]
MESFDAIVIGAGVIGSSVAYHLAHLGCKKVLVLERTQIGSGTTSQSSGILRTHYSVIENVRLAQASWQVFNDFQNYLGDADAAAGLVKCGYLIAAPEGAKLAPLEASLKAQRAQGIEVQFLSREHASELLPIARFDDAALIGYEPEAGFADAYLVATSFARAARRQGVKIIEGVAVEKLLLEGGKVAGVQTSMGTFFSGTVISTQNIWATDIERWTGIPSPVVPERHSVLALEGPRAYTFQMPVCKDLGSPGMLYCRSYGGTQMLVSEGIAGETLPTPDNAQGDVSMDYMLEVGGQVAERFPSYETAGVASSWTGVYDVTPDWNPVLGRLPDLPGLVVGYGFSGHGFKLSPAVGRLLAQSALGLKTEVDITPYALERFRTGKLLTGKYGLGAVS